MPSPSLHLGIEPVATRVAVRAARGVSASCLAFALLAGFALPRPAPGLDPAKALSQFGHDTWTSERGLPTDNVAVLVQTADGYLWIGTQNGLVRFDGVRFVLFNQRNSPALAHPEIRSLAPRRAGGLWVGTWRGLYRLAGDRLLPVPVVAADPHAVIEDLYEAPDGTLWVATQGYGVARLAPGRPPHFFTPQDGLPHDAAYTLAADRDGSIWVGLRRGLARLRGDVVEDLSAAAGLADSSVRRLRFARDGSLWMATSDGLVHATNGAFRRYGREDGLSNPNIDTVLEDRDGNLWVGARGGLFRLRDGTFTRYGKAEGLLDDLVHTLLEDREGSLWVGTRDGGLERFRDGKFLPYGRAEGLAADIVNAIYRDRTGALWFSTQNGLTRRKAGTVRTWTKKDGLYVSIVTALAEDHRGRLWVGTAAGLNWLEGERIFQFRPADRRLEGSIGAVHEDRQGSLWIGGPTEILFRLRGGELRAYGEADGMGGTGFSAFADSRDGGLWISTTARGIAHFKDGVFTLYGPPQGLADGDVEAPVVEDADGTVWVATYGGGLARLQHGRFAAITSRQGLYDDTLLHLVDDGLGYLWLGADSGICRVAKRDLHAVADGRAATLPARVYGTVDGMRSAEASGGAQPAALRTGDGRLWFATVRGAVTVDPRDLPQPGAAPAVIVERLTVDGLPMPLAPRVRLPAGSHRFQVDFTAPTFLAADQLRFRARLEGFDRDWVELGGTRSVTYTNLAPGPYRLRLAVAPAGGAWSPQAVGLELVLAPRFYQTAWFLAASALAVALTAWAAYRLHLRQLRLRYESILAERGRIAGDLHDTLAQSLAALSLQIEGSGQTLATDPAAARAHLARAHDLVGDSLQASRRLVWNLRETETDLAASLRRLGEPFAGVDGSPVAVAVTGRRRPLPADVERHLLCIGQEAVANAVRHGHAHHVTIEVRFEDGRVLLLVEDDGTGFSAEELARQGNGHYGLRGICERAGRLQGSVRVDSQPGGGTRIRVEVPLPEPTAEGARRESSLWALQEREEKRSRGEEDDERSALAVEGGA